MKILVIILLVIILAGGGAAGWFFFLKEDPDAVAEEVVEELPPAPPVYVRFNPLQLPLIGDDGIEQVIDIIVALEVPDQASADLVIAMAPRLNDAILRDLYGVLHTSRIMRNGIVNVTAVKQRIVAVAKDIMGEELISDALVQGVAQRPM
jgi:flagellar FliL protein